MLIAQSVAAAIPGPRDPNLSAADPSAGPIATPTFVAAESQPSAFARFCGSTESATYAWMTPTVPPPAPCTNRDNNNNQIELANAKTRYAIPAALRPTSNAGRRPYLSENRPQIGALINCAAVNAPISIAT